MNFMMSSTSAVPVPKEHHCKVFGKKSTCHKEIEKQTVVHILIPSIQDTSDIINDTETRDIVENALQDISMISYELSKKTVERIEIPKIYHPFITGGHNENLNNLMKETGVKIIVPPSFINSDKIAIVNEKQEESKRWGKITATSTVPVLGSKEYNCQAFSKKRTCSKKKEERTCARTMPRKDTSDIIKVIGTRDAVEKVVQEIRMISNELSKRAFDRIEIPKIYHPFITGGYNENLKNVMKETGVMISVPPPFINSDKIAVVGGKEGVQLAIEMIKQIYEIMATSAVPMSKENHCQAFGKKNTCREEIEKRAASCMMLRNPSDIINVTGIQDAGEKSVQGVCIISDELSKKAVESIEIPKIYQPFITRGEPKINLKKLMKETGVKIVPLLSKAKDIIKITGDKEGVQLAVEKIKQIVEKLDTSVVPVPKEHHCLLIGRRGTQCKKIEKQTGTRIQVPSIQDTSDIIKVTGTRDAVEKACQEIRLFSNELSKKAYDRIEIPKIYHPFITGGHNENLKNLMKETGVMISVPPLSEARDKITITGDKEGVQLATEKIKQIYEKMEKESVICFVEVPKQKHKYFWEYKRKIIQDILLETNVSVEMPWLDSSEETVTLRGLYKDLDRALTRLYELVDSMTSETIECPLDMALNTFYGTAHDMTWETIECPRWIYRFLIRENGSNLRNLIKDNEKVYVKFSDEKIIVKGPTNMVSNVIDSLKKAIDCYVSIKIVVEL